MCHLIYEVGQSSGLAHAIIKVQQYRVRKQVGNKVVHRQRTPTYVAVLLYDRHANAQLVSHAFTSS